jgi:hypothetical protein
MLVAGWGFGFCFEPLLPDMLGYESDFSIEYYDSL